MYPETDIPPLKITPEMVDRISAFLPESAGKRQQRLSKQYGLNEKLARQIVDSEYSSLFDAIVNESGVSATTVAVFLTETLKSLKRDGVHIEDVSDQQVKDIFYNVGKGKLAKEAVSDVFTWLSKNDGKTVQDAMAALGYRMFTVQELSELVDNVIAKNKAHVEKLGKAAFGFVMGAVMKEARGKVSPEAVSTVIKEKLR